MPEKRIAVFPGSFDPVTIGHFNIVQRSADLFDTIILAIGVNALKKTMFTTEERMTMLKQAFRGIDNVEVVAYEGLTINFCREREARFMLRGIRNTIDFEYEKSIAQMNASLDKRIETIMLFTDPAYSAINSSIVRDILRNEGNIQQYLPEGAVLPNRSFS